MMEHQAFALLERCLRRGKLEEVGLHLRERADFTARYPDLEGVERSVVEILRGQAGLPRGDRPGRAPALARAPKG